MLILGHSTKIITTDARYFLIDEKKKPDFDYQDFDFDDDDSCCYNIYIVLFILEFKDNNKKVLRLQIHCAKM